MVDKQVYELSLGDLESCGVWYFPMDESVKDEQTVRPLLEKETCTDFQIIVRTRFVASDGFSYLGYLYWDGGREVGFLQPVIILEDGSLFTFWNGMSKPSWADFSTKAQALRRGFPFSYTSESLLELPEISGRLEGLYYLDGDQVSLVS